MKHLISILLFVLLVKILPAQTSSNKAPYDIALTKYLNFLSYTNKNGASDTILTEDDSLNGKEYGRYFIKKVRDPYYYVYLNSKKINFYYFIDYSITDIEDNKFKVCFQMGMFKSKKRGLFKKPTIQGVIPFDRGYTQTYFYSFDCEKKQWLLVGVIR